MSSSTSNPDKSHTSPKSPFTLPKISTEAELAARKRPYRNSSAMISSIGDLSPRHQQIITAVIKNLATSEVDWEVVARESGCNTGRYARDEFNKAQKKLNDGTRSAAAGTTMAASSLSSDKNATTTPRERTNSSDQDDEDDEEAGEVKARADDDHDGLV